MNDSIFKLIDESYEMFEKKQPRVKQISGYSYPDYISLLVFADAFIDVIEQDSPTIAAKVKVPGKNIVKGVVGYFDKMGLDVWDFANHKDGLDLVDKINSLWGEEFSVEALLEFDENALVSVVLRALGHEVPLDPDVRLMLKSNGVTEPSSSNIGMADDQKRYESAYSALEAINTIEGKHDNLSESFMHLFGTEKEPKPEKTGKIEAQAIKLIESILKQLKLRYHLDKEKGDEGTVLRHHITINKEQYVLKSYVIYESGHISSVLWDKDEDNFFLVAVLGYLKDFYALLAFGKHRLKAWMEKEHGSNRSE